MKHTLKIWPLLAAAFLAASCVNEDYDLNDLDTALDVSFDITAPIGSAEFIKLSDFISLDTESDSSILVIDEDGNYLISFTTDEALETDVEIPSVAFDLDAITAIDVYIDLTDFQSSWGSIITQDMLDLMDYYEQSTVQTSDIPDDASSKITVEYDLPEGLVDVQKIALSEGEVSISITSSTPLYLNKGLTLTFPEFITLGAKSGSTYSLDEAGHVITISEDYKISDSQSFSLEFYINNLNLDALPEGNGIVENESGALSLLIDDEDVAVKVEGTVSIDLKDYVGQELPSQVSFDIALETTEFDAQYVIAKIDFNYEIESMTISISEIPEDLSGDNIFLDVYNPVVLISVDNGSALSLVLDGDFEASLNGVSTIDSPVHIGANTENHPTDKVKIQPNTFNNLYLSRREYTTMLDGGVNVVVPRLGELLSTIPDTIIIDNVVIATDNDDYVTIYPDNCSCSVEYAIEAPLAFGEDLYLRYELALSGLDGTLNGINQDVDPKSGLYLDVLEIAGEIVSTIPASFEISAEPIDADGNVISGIALTVKGDGQIKGGSIDNPVTSELVIYLSIEETSNVAALDGLNLILTGSSNSEIAGVCLNENQGLKINDISAHVVGSYVLSFEE